MYLENERVQRSTLTISEITSPICLAPLHTNVIGMSMT